MRNPNSVKRLPTCSSITNTSEGSHLTHNRYLNIVCKSMMQYDNRQATFLLVCVCVCMCACCACVCRACLVCVYA